MPAGEVAKSDHDARVDFLAGFTSIAVRRVGKACTNIRIFGPKPRAKFKLFRQFSSLTRNQNIVCVWFEIATGAGKCARYHETILFAV
jgi:hypothetical protein